MYTTILNCESEVGFIINSISVQYIKLFTATTGVPVPASVFTQRTSTVVNMNSYETSERVRVIT